MAASPDAVPTLSRTLRSRHVALISIGGIIGAGLFVGSSANIATVGPAVLVSYAIAGALMFLVMRMLAKDPKLASRMEDNLHRVIDAVGLRSKAGQARLAEVEALFEIEEAGAAKPFEGRRVALASGATEQPERRQKH